MTSLMYDAIAPSTRKVYAAGVRMFKSFCKSHDLCSLPASELTIRLFCTAQSIRVSFSTISTYVSAVRMYHLERGPTADALLLALLLQGIKRRYRPYQNSRQPITATILRHLRPALDSLPLTSHQAALYWAAFTLAFYAFLRVGEYTSQARTKGSPSTLLRNNLTLQASTITIRLRKSQYRSPPPIFVAATYTDTCPVAALQQFLSR